MPFSMVCSNPGIEPQFLRSPALAGHSLPLAPLGKTHIMLPIQTKKNHLIYLHWVQQQKISLSK